MSEIVGCNVKRFGGYFVSKYLCSFRFQRPFNNGELQITWDPKRRRLKNHLLKSVNVFISHISPRAKILKK